MSKNLKVSRQTLLKIVEEVRKRPCLWNPDHEHNNNRARVAIAWDEITTILKMPEPLIKAKWKMMRNIFTREMKRCRNNVKGELEYTGQWRYFKLLRFIHKPKEAELVDLDLTEESESSTEQVIIKEEIQDSEKIINDTQENHSALEDSNIFMSVDLQPEQDPLPIKRRQSEDDCDLMFFKSLLPYCRNLDPVRKLRLRSKLLDVVINEISSSSHGALKH